MAGYLPPGHRRLNLGSTAMIRVLLWDIDNTLLTFPPRSAWRCRRRSGTLPWAPAPRIGWPGTPP